jgi:hypothetical protein
MISNIFKSLTTFLVICCVISCSSETKKEVIEFSNKQLQAQDSLFKEIMVIHDEVMPLTSTLVKRKDILEKSGQKDSTTLNLINELDNAEQAMWDWMYSIKRPEQLRDSMNNKQITSYLSNEFDAIKNVKNLMLSAEKNSAKISPNE